MLKIIVNNREVDLGELKGITLQYNSTLFEFKKLKGSYTIPFNVPLSDINKDIFNFPFRIGSVNDEIRIFDIEIWHSGILIEKGLVEAKSFKNKNITCTAYINNGNFFKKLNEKKLPDIFEGINENFQIKPEYDYENDDYLLFEVNNDDFLKDTLWEEEHFSLLWGSHIKDFDYAELGISGSSFLNVEKYRHIIGWDKYLHPYLYISIHDLGGSGPKALNAYFTESDMNSQTNLVFYVLPDINIVVGAGGSGFSGELQVNSAVTLGDKYKIIYVAATKTQNAFSQTNSASSVTYPYFHNFKPYIITPFPLLWKTLKHFFKKLNYLYEDDFFTSDWFKRLVIYSNNNLVEALFYDPPTKKVRNIMPSVFPFADILPNIDSEKFIIALQNFFNIYFFLKDDKVKIIDRNVLHEHNFYDDFNNNFIKFTSKIINKKFEDYILNIGKDGKDKLTSDINDYGQNESILFVPQAPANWEDNLKSGDIVHWGDEYKIYKSKYVYWVADDAYYLYEQLYDIYRNDNTFGINATKFQSFAHNKKGFDINLYMSALSIYNEDYEGNNMLRTQQKGNTYIDGISNKNECSFRLMYYNGLQLYNENDVEKPFGSQSYGQYTISPEWSYEFRWSSFIDWYKTASVINYEAELILSASELKNLDFTRKKLINNDLFFIKSLKVQLLKNSIVPAKAVMIKA